MTWNDGSARQRWICRGVRARLPVGRRAINGRRHWGACWYGTSAWAGGRVGVVMVQVRRVRMAVPDRIMPMPMTVRSLRHRVMVVVMVAVVMPMGVLVFERLVLMLVGMRFGQMQRDPAKHQQTPDCGQPRSGLRARSPDLPR
jgi:hypothetical protein